MHGAAETLETKLQSKSSILGCAASDFFVTSSIKGVHDDKMLKSNSIQCILWDQSTRLGAGQQSPVLEKLFLCFQFG